MQFADLFSPFGKVNILKMIIFIFAKSTIEILELKNTEVAIFQSVTSDHVQV